MKNKILMAVSFVALALVCQPSTLGQLPNQTPAPPRPETGTRKPSGTPTGIPPTIINSTLLIYTKNGVGTNYTNTGGEFPSQLTASANVNKSFTLHWTRPKPGKAEQAKLYISVSPTLWIPSQEVTMPAGSTSVDIPYSMKTQAPKFYEMKVVGPTVSSSQVTINYTGKDNTGADAVLPEPPKGGAPFQSFKVKVVGAKYTPRVGTSSDPGFQPAKLSLTLVAADETPIKGIMVEVYSEPFKNSEYITASDSKNSPIPLFSGHREGPYALHPGVPKVITILLHHTSKGQVNAQEAGPGIYSPGDWNLAYGQTTTASFRWSVDQGKLTGSFDQSVKKPWQLSQ